MGSRPVIRVVHPCGRLRGHEAALTRGITALEESGCEVRWDPSAADSSWRGYLAGDDQRRLHEFCAALIEDDVDVVWFARGGSGANRIASGIIHAARNLAPRAVVGFSDATGILMPLTQRLGWRSFHGPVVTSLGREEPLTDLSQCLGILKGEHSLIEFPPIKAPRTTGRLVGGNLTVLSTMLGTALSPQPELDGIWLLEDVGEAPYRIDRAFWQLVSAGIFKGASAIWVGDLGFDDPSIHADVVEHLGEDAPCPVIPGAPIGHIGRLALVPFGVEMVVDFEMGRMRPASA